VPTLFCQYHYWVNATIFNQRQVRTKFEVAKANQEKAYLQFEQSLLTAGKEVSDALAQYNNETYKITIHSR
jgi:outer membrane protein TolC